MIEVKKLTGLTCIAFVLLAGCGGEDAIEENSNAASDASISLSPTETSTTTEATEIPETVSRHR